MQIRHFFYSNHHFNTILVKKQIIYFTCSKFFLISFKKSSGILSNFIDTYCIKFKSYKRLKRLKKIKVGKLFLKRIKTYHGKSIYCQFLYSKKLKLKRNFNKLILKYHLNILKCFFIKKRIKGGLLGYFNRVLGFISYKYLKKIKKKFLKNKYFFKKFFLLTTLQIKNKPSKIFLSKKRKRRKKRKFFFRKKKRYKKRKHKYVFKIKFIFTLNNINKFKFLKI
jgi:hypothetical protein